MVSCLRCTVKRLIRMQSNGFISEAAILIYEEGASQFAGIDVTGRQGVDGQTRHRADTQLLHDVAAVRNDGRKPDLQAVGDLFVHIAAGDQRQHFGFAARKGRGFGTHRAGNDVFGPVRAVVHAQDGADDRLLVGADVDAVHVRISRLGLSAAKQDRFAAPGAEETAVRDEQLRRHEEVEEAFRVRFREGFEVAEEFDVGGGNDLFEDGFHPDAHQDVGRCDGYGGTALHRLTRGDRVRC